MTLRDRLAEIRRELDQAQKAPVLYAMNPAKVVGLVWKLYALLEAIVVDMEKK